jgi:hypothetical protein
MKYRTLGKLNKQNMEVAVFGLGESLALYGGGCAVTFGVNDIWRAMPVDYLVCIDERERFTPERLAYIDAARPQRFYSQLEQWQARPDFYAITLQEQYPDYVCQLNLPALPKSLCSPFVAAAIAYKLHGATSIHLYGVDLLTHPHLKDYSLQAIRRHFGTLKKALAAGGCQLIVHGNGLLRSL